MIALRFTNFLSINVDQKPDMDFNHKYLGFGIHDSECNVKIWNVGSYGLYILFTDLGVGTSVINACEQLINEIYIQYFDEYDKLQLTFAETTTDYLHVDIALPVWEGDECIKIIWKPLGNLIDD